MSLRLSHLGLATALALAAPWSAHALPPEMGGDDGPVTAGVPQDAAARAGISETQQKEIARLTTEANAELDALRKKHRAAQAALEALLKTAAPDEDAVLAQVDAMGAAETAIRKNRVALMLRIRKVLGPALWANLQSELNDGRLAQQPRAPHTPGDEDTPRVGEPVQTETTSGTLRSHPKQH